jgi:hypothetical protein
VPSGGAWSDVALQPAEGAAFDFQTLSRARDERPRARYERGRVGSCRCRWKLQMYEHAHAATAFRTGQYAPAEASQGRRATQRGSCYGSKPAQRVRFGIEHNVIEIQC